MMNVCEDCGFVNINQCNKADGPKGANLFFAARFAPALPDPYPSFSQLADDESIQAASSIADLSESMWENFKLILPESVLEDAELMLSFLCDQASRPQVCSWKIIPMNSSQE
ncbi:MAG: hypothetical protein GDA56_07195 [Hormoscilla sp. GM7CHS1pb]|nr:hypothetical protein [Hormoscilla sp. GM7CHS1pb]